MKEGSFLRFSEARVSVGLLIEQGQFDQAIQMLERALPSIHTGDEWQRALELVERIPESDWLASPEAAFVFVRVLYRNKLLAATLEWSARVLELYELPQASAIQIERGGALIEMHRYEEAHAVLESALPYLQGELLGVAYSRLGLSLHFLRMPWRDAFVKARTLLWGEELGKALLNEGFCFSEDGRGGKARDVWLEALPLFQFNPRMLAWLRYNLGISALRDLDSQAERHFLNAEQLTQKTQATQLRSSVLRGLAGSRRALGEWLRAESSYCEALRIATDTNDRKEARLGLIRTLRLAGRHVEALETLELALADTALEHDLFHVARAKVFLALNQNDRARQSLAHVGQLVSVPDQWLERIARAELARRDGHLDEAVRLLDGLPVHTLHAREEVRQWPQLFALLAAAGKPVPEPLEYVQGTRVRVVALGVLQVTVNGRDVPIAPTSKAGELLVFLLEQNGAASLEVIADAVYPDSTHERARKSIWMLVKSLRDALGWSDAVRALRGAYQLDPGATWAYDVREARLGGAQARTFLSGVYSEWALEVGRELEGLILEPHQNPNLN